MTQMEYLNYLRYWGKTNKSNKDISPPYHLLAYHCLDVAACGYYIIKNNIFDSRSILEKCGIIGTNAENWIIWFLASHDIGKFARGFQKYAEFPDSPLVPPVSGISALERHDSLGFYLWGKLLEGWSSGSNEIIAGIEPENRARFESALNSWMLISTGHHGIPPDTMKNRSSLAFTDEDIVAATHYLEALSELFPFTLPQEWKTKAGRKCLKQHSWFFAGLVTLADWMGSDETQFPMLSEPMSLKEYWPLACEKAQQAILRMPPLSQHSHYQDHRALFPFIQTLTPLQQRASELDISAPGAQLVVLEDVTGAGKTEAALILTHRLMSANKGHGLYVGLPTMATANAMYQRLASAYHALFTDESRPSLILAHGGREMSDSFRQSIWQPTENIAEDYARDDGNATTECHTWFADSRKKALLAEVGVGTLDQLLMAVMPFRHQSLRLLGMRDKILLLDEVHAYDGYMVKLLEGLLRFHAAQGGSAIILSATLPAALREKLLNAFSDGAGFMSAGGSDNAGYPWLSHLTSSGLLEQPLATRPEVQRTVAVNWIQQRQEALDIIYRVVSAGQCVCWIRNTVDDALDTYQQLLHEGIVPEQDLLLFHSRFAFIDRIAIENKTLNWFGNNAPVSERRGKVLIATQVVEQSLDLDFDWMITDLAPIDLLIQRAGRLQRHIRDAHGQRKSTLPDERQPPVLHILSPHWQEQAEEGWLGQELKGTGFVYADHACLWRTQALLRQYGEIRMPDNARTLVDGVYEQKITAPEGLQTLSDIAFGKVLSQRSVAAQNLLRHDLGYDREASDFLWDKDREFSTRLGEESVDIYLAWQDEEGELHPVVAQGDFCWEMSRLSVRLSWWRKQSGEFLLPGEEALERFRKKQHRPTAQVVLVSAEGEARYYNKQTGLGSQ
ncbi:CRISPR-associated helicase/endonuclease Cas3 [Salmonella enterica]|uniref:CRISPR-associated helicase/endonuclease Cas3 n=1 Tax=Salmonella enterica TaxID=28901 RepID=UPI0009AC7323|nr:CRISPR-associated helicase/endonuclease Cas3 [Salmonella enterica]EBG4355391.1 CRISPR-associated helicase/endonuclease Cas3 [Salmonella enterica subsp. enterica]EBZ6046817.1 CRISPR-associated helicase/endonuclease Cas3 [Salmonella enterica subsp. enterica serovar Texas]ECS6015231.1 CRISPR-associated helicase/endonuclease Cas3 [Salmonella enterica subsp. enterica serovar Rough O:k:1,5]EDX2367977.1 CRISPR-associated helicase/endonuclease Cas3 [Salmonella enterica subsp. enterica serovar Memphi